MAKPKAGKAKKGGKVSGERKPKKGGRRPDGGLGLRPDEIEAQHHRHVEMYIRAEDKKNEAGKAFTAVKKDIEKEGGSVARCKFAASLRKDDGDVKFQERIAMEAQVAKWEGVGVQLSMFADDPKDAVFEDGKRTAMRGEAPKAPSHLAQKAQQRWLSGWHVGNDARNATLNQTLNGGDGFKPLSEAAAGLAEKAGITASLGTVPPTHQEAA